MQTYYKEYRWKEGKPVGIQRCKREESLCYRLVSDPYRKWLTIELYREGAFALLVYDSNLLDFRKLKPELQRAWRREAIDRESAWIYNEDDRLILQERYEESGCAIYSPHGILICRYVLNREKAQVLLVDSRSRPVTLQQYRTYDRGEFIDLIEESRSPTERNLPAHM